MTNQYTGIQNTFLIAITCILMVGPLGSVIGLVSVKNNWHQKVSTTH